MPAVTTQEFQFEALHELIGDATATYVNVLRQMTLHLGTLNLPYDQNTPLSSCTPGEATYQGYSADTVTWNAPDLSAASGPEIMTTNNIWRPTGSASPNMVYGWWGLFPGSGSIACIGKFANAPVPMASALDLIQLVIRISVSASVTTVEMY